MQNNFKHKTLIQIRFKDVDAFGHVNNANHFTYLEMARFNYLNEVLGVIDWERQGIILAKAVIDYKLPILLHDKVFVYTCCIKTGTKSFELGYMIVKNNENEKEQELASGSTTLVCFDYERGNSIEMPEEWKQKLKKFDEN